MIRRLPALILIGFAWTASAETGNFATLMPPPDAVSRLISAPTDPGRRSMAGLPQALREQRQAMLDGLPVPTESLRDLAERDDGLAAMYLARQLADTAAPPSDIAWYSTIAVRAGRVQLLPMAVSAMYRLDPQTEPAERKRAYMDMLYAHAFAGNALALDAVIDLNGEGRLFGALSDATRDRLLAMGDTQGDGRVPLRMAIALIQSGDATPEEAALARDYLARAAGGSDLSLSVIAQTLLRELAP